MSSQTPEPEDDRTVIRPPRANVDTTELIAKHANDPTQLIAKHANDATELIARHANDATEMIPRSGAGAAPASTPGSAASSAGDSGNALPVGTYLGEFELTSVLGEGGFGIVYLAWDHSLERRVALKEYMPAALAARTGTTQVQVKSARHRDTFEAGRKSFVNEAKLLAQFDHPSLVKVYRFWEANGTAYMVMPFYEGITMKDKLREFGGPPDEAWLMGLLAPLTEALAVIHTERCYHRDIAPDNVILLNPNGRPLLLDFGAARRVIGDMTQALTVILKPGYAPVEQYAEAPNMKQGAWTDVYALAASIHFAIMGRTPPTSVGRLMGDSYVPLEQSAAGRYSPRFLQAMDKALRVRPEDRTQTVQALRADLGLDAAHVEAQETQLNPGALADAPRPTLRAADAPPPSTRIVTELHPSQRTEMAPAPAKGGKGLWIGLGVLALAAAGVGTYVALSPAKAPAPTVAATPPAATPAPAPAPAPVAAAPVPPARMDVSDEFDKVVAGQAGGFLVEASPAKQQFRIGKDALAFSVKSSREGYVNVLLLGPDGSLLQLFPNTQATDNRIRAGQTLALPQKSWPLDAAEPPGPEHFLVIVSPQPRDYSALSTEREDFFLKLPTGERGGQMAAQWPRKTPLLLGAPPASCTGDNCEVYGAARFTLNVQR